MEMYVVLEIILSIVIIGVRSLPMYSTFVVGVGLSGGRGGGLARL